MKCSNVAAFIMGAIAGGVAALLYAPQDGKKTRMQVRDFVDDGVGQVRDFVNKTAEKAKNAARQGVEQLKSGANQARDFVKEEIADVRAEMEGCPTCDGKKREDNK